MAKDDYRFALSADKYLEKHHILTYIEDAITQLLEHKDENPRVNSNKFFGDYFTSVKEGNHVMFREYAFVRATPHNRMCFVRTFWKCFRNIGRKGDLLSIKEYHSLICLLCPNFPFEPVQKTARIILMDDALDSLISFADFLYAFQIQFCYEEFLQQCAEVYKDLLHKPQNSHDMVVVPTSEESPKLPKTSGGQGTGSAAEGADAMVFFRSLLPVCEKLDVLAPPVPVLRDILSSVQRVTFYGFLMAMAKSNVLNEKIGKLPNKGELWTVSDPELTSAQCKNEPVIDTVTATPIDVAKAPSQQPMAAVAEVLPPGEPEPPIRPSSALKAQQRPLSSIVDPTILTRRITDPELSPQSATMRDISSSAPLVRPRSSRLAAAREKALRRQNAPSSDSDDDDDSGSGSSTN